MTARKSVGMSPFEMVTGVQPIMPLDFAEATYLVPQFTTPLSHTDLIAIRAHQLEKCEEDLDTVRAKVMAARYASIDQFNRQHL